ncbi:MAG: helix-turn-helix domain-containing protein [Actinomycetota bacterium]
MTKRQWLDVAGAAEWLEVKERFIRRLVAERRIEYHKFGSHIRFDARDLDAYADANRVPRSEAA